MRHIIIGDIHGCLFELKTLIKKLKLVSSDKLYFIGDLIDRGPESIGVVKYVRDLAEQYSVVLILGNHEEKLLRFIHHTNANSDFAHKMLNAGNISSLLNHLNTPDIDFLSSSYINYNIFEKNICILHGGIPGNCKFDLSYNYKYSFDIFKTHKGLELLLKTRFLDEHGNVIVLGEENEKSVFWADYYKSQYGKIIFGHHAIVSAKPKLYTNAINIDTGCVYGGWLSCCISHDENMSYLSVKARKDYCNDYR